MSWWKRIWRALKQTGAEMAWEELATYVPRLRCLQEQLEDIKKDRVDKEPTTCLIALCATLVSWYHIMPFLRMRIEMLKRSSNDKYRKAAEALDHVIGSIEAMASYQRWKLSRVDPITSDNVWLGEIGSRLRNVTFARSQPRDSWQREAANEKAQWFLDNFNLEILDSLNELLAAMV